MPLITTRASGGAFGLGWSAAGATGFEVPSGYNTTNLIQHFDAAIMSSYPGSGATVTDLSGNNNNGTLVNGVSWSEVDSIPAFVFDGTNDYINSNLTIQSQNPYTFDFWLNLSPGYTGYAFGKGGYYSTYYAFYGYVSDSSDRIAIVSHGGGGSQLLYTYTVADPGWVNITFIIDFNGSPRKAIYVNGSLVASNNLRENYLNNSLTMPYGAYRYAPTSTQTDAASAVGGYFVGAMGVIAQYTRALSASEIASNFNGYRGRFGV